MLPLKFFYRKCVFFLLGILICQASNAENRFALEWGNYCNWNNADFSVIQSSAKKLDERGWKVTVSDGKGEAKHYEPGEKNLAKQNFFNFLENAENKAIKGDEIFIHVNTHGSHEDSTHAHGWVLDDCSVLAVNDPELIAHLEKLKQKGLKIAFADESCSGGSSVKDLGKYGCVVTNQGKTLSYGHAFSDAELEAMSAPSKGDISIAEIYKSMLSAPEGSYGGILEPQISGFSSAKDRLGSLVDSSSSECDECNHVERSEIQGDIDHYTCSQSAFTKNFADVVALTSALASKKQSEEKDELSELLDQSKKFSDLLKKEDELITTNNFSNMFAPGLSPFSELSLDAVAPEFVKAISSPPSKGCKGDESNEWCSLYKLDMVFTGNIACSELHHWCIRSDGKFILPLYTEADMDIVSARAADFRKQILEPFYERQGTGVPQAVKDYGKIEIDKVSDLLISMSGLPLRSKFTPEQLKAHNDALLQQEINQGELRNVEDQIATLTLQTNARLQALRLKRFEKASKALPIFKDKKLQHCEQFKL